MASSLITKKRIAKAFKELFLENDFEKISIVTIMDRAGIRRQTFYNHFLDKYQLLDWIFQNDLKEQITDNLDFISGKHLLQELFHYLEEEQPFYQKAFEIHGQNNFFSYFIDYCQLIVEKILTDYPGQSDFPQDSTFLAFHKNYQTLALAETLKQVVQGQIPRPNPDYILAEITGTNLRRTL